MEEKLKRRDFFKYLRKAAKIGVAIGIASLLIGSNCSSASGEPAVERETSASEDSANTLIPKLIQEYKDRLQERYEAAPPEPKPVGSKKENSANDPVIAFLENFERRQRESRELFKAARDSLEDLGPSLDDILALRSDEVSGTRLLELLKYANRYLDQRIERYMGHAELGEKRYHFFDAKAHLHRIHAFVKKISSLEERLAHVGKLLILEGPPANSNENRKDSDSLTDLEGLKRVLGQDYSAFLVEKMLYARLYPDMGVVERILERTERFDKKYQLLGDYFAKHPEELEGFPIDYEVGGVIQEVGDKFVIHTFSDEDDKDVSKWVAELKQGRKNNAIEIIQYLGSRILIETQGVHRGIVSELQKKFEELSMPFLEDAPTDALGEYLLRLSRNDFHPDSIPSHLLTDKDTLAMFHTHPSSGAGPSPQDLKLSYGYGPGVVFSFDVGRNQTFLDGYNLGELMGRRVITR
ncbi:hypothetical protein HYU14_07500 [Candidatus Woesearchaeota archaeon]|nr:hypothetical protein [Candidatus Woesearchaeota archaeon]